MISLRAAELVPYTAGEQPKAGEFIKLNTNENPYDAGAKALKALKEFDISSLRLYPDPDATELRQRLAECEGVDAENIFVGNGSDEVLALAFYALFDGNIAFADVTYSFYPVYCRLHGISYTTLPLKDDFSLSPDDYIDKGFGGVVLANPNAPTSLLLDRGSVERIIARNKCNVIVDEAYIDFAPENSSVVPLIRRYPNLLAVKTFSKSYSLAGIRCGYAVGQKPLIDALRLVKDSFNSYPLDGVCQAVCAAAADDADYHNACCGRVVATRNSTAAALRASGFNVLSSGANFLFISPPPIAAGKKAETTAAEGADCDGKRLFDYLRENKILVRRWSNPKRIENFLRVSIGSEQEMSVFINKATEWIKRR